MMRDKVRIRDVEAGPGERARGYVELGSGPAAPIAMPLVIVNGVEPGPTLCVTAGVHATEYPAIDAVMSLLRSLDPAQLAGTVIAVPIVNVPMFESRMGFLSPIDGLNLNRTAPGSADGSMTERLAHTLLTEVVGRAEYHIDCHGGDLGELLWPYAGYALTGDVAMDRKGEALVRAYSPRIFALYEKGSPLPPTPGSVTREATLQGTVSILAEAGSNGMLDPDDVQIHLNGLQNVMRHLGMIPGAPIVKADMLRAVGQFIVRCGSGGLVRLAVGVGQEVAAGDVIAEIVNVFGDVVETVRSPEPGIARLIWNAKAVHTGDPLVKFWRVEPAPAFGPS